MPYGKGARFVSRLTRNTLALILAGGRGDRLKDLTRWRAKPAVPFGGKFRIIDFPLSNCVNSGIRRIGVLTQYKAHSLIRHLQSGWGFLHKQLGEFVEIREVIESQQNRGRNRATVKARVAFRKRETEVTMRFLYLDDAWRLTFYIVELPRPDIPVTTPDDLF